MVTILKIKSSRKHIREHFLTHFYETRIILIPNPDKDITRKENYRAVSFMNTDAKTLYKMLANCMQKYTKIIINHDWAEFIPGMQGWFKIQQSITVIHHISKLNLKNHMNWHRQFHKIQHLHTIKSLGKLEWKETPSIW